MRKTLAGSPGKPRIAESQERDPLGRSNVRHDVHAESVGQFFENDRLAGTNERSE